MPLVESIIVEIANKIVEISNIEKTKWEILEDLKGLTESNPVSQPNIFKTLLPHAVLSHLTDEHKAAIANHEEHFNNLMEAIITGDRETAKNIILLALGAGIISAAEATAIRDYADGLVPDPNWQPLLRWVMWRLGRSLTAEEIERAKNYLGY